jgi:Zn-dependent protease/CBS domain-containing protein
MAMQSFRIGKVLGIPIGVNSSWFIIFALITISFSTQFAHLHPAWTEAQHLTFGIITSLLFFASVLLHELGHSVVALRYGIPVRSITLFIFGGVARIAREPSKPSQEFQIAIAGPAVSALLGVLFYVVSAAARGTMEGISSLGQWLGYINVTLALFNLIPGFPLDGGRVLRALVWKVTGSFERATNVAAGAGQVFAYGFILFGAGWALKENFFGGLWIGFIGWFLLTAAQTTSAQVSFRNALQGITAGDLMIRDCLEVPGSLSIAELVEHHLLRSGARCVMVTDSERFRGILTLHEIKKVPREEWESTSLQAAMVPAEAMVTVGPATPVNQVLQAMIEGNFGQVPVVEGGRLLGVVRRDSLLALVETRLELKA